MARACALSAPRSRSKSRCGKIGINGCAIPKVQPVATDVTQPKLVPPGIPLGLKVGFRHRGHRPFGGPFALANRVSFLPLRTLPQSLSAADIHSVFSTRTCRSNKILGTDMSSTSQTLAPVGRERSAVSCSILGGADGFSPARMCCPRWLARAVKPLCTADRLAQRAAAARRFPRAGNVRGGFQRARVFDDDITSGQLDRGNLAAHRGHVQFL